MRTTPLGSMLGLGLGVFVAAVPAFAVIKPDTSMKAVYGMCTQVIHGEITGIDLAKRTVHAKVLKTAAPRKARTSSNSGDPALLGEQVTIELAESLDLVGTLAKGDPVLVFVGVRGSGVHLADTWLAAEGTGPDFKVTATMDLGLTFPGRTEALARLVGELNEGKYSLLDKVNHHTFVEGWKEVGDLGAKAISMVLGDADGDKRPDLLVLTGAGSKLYLDVGSAAPLGREVAGAWGIAATSCRVAAFGDVNGDGKEYLLLDALWVSTGSKFIASKTGVSLKGMDVLAVAIADVTGDGRADAVALARDGRLLAFENVGSADGPWTARPPKILWKGGEEPLAAHFAEWTDLGKLSVMVIRPGGLMHYPLADRDGPPADFARLTGEKLPTDRTGKPTLFPVVGYMASGAMDFNGGDGRPELFMATESGAKGRDMGLVNRGFGTFRLNREGHLGLARSRGPARVSGRVTALAFHPDVNPAWSASTTLAAMDTGRLFRCDSWACNKFGNHIVPGTPTERDQPGPQCARSTTDLRPRP